MKTMKIRNTCAAARRAMVAAAAVAMIGTSITLTTGSTAYAEATTHVVEAKGVKFAPLFIYIEPGDQVSFERMASHNIETLDAMVPEGQEKINSELGETVVETFDIEGIVVYKCTPHWGNRMGGIIVVGQPEDPGAILDQYMQATEDDKQYLPARGLLKKLRKDMEDKGLI